MILYVCGYFKTILFYIDDKNDAPFITKYGELSSVSIYDTDREL